MMTRREFEAIAAIIRGDLACCSNDGERYRVRGIALSLADLMHRSNSRFNRAKFYLACGLTSDGSLV